MIKTAKQLKDLILWQAYQKKFIYASDIPWEEIMQSVRALHQKAVSI